MHQPNSKLHSPGGNLGRPQLLGFLFNSNQLSWGVSTDTSFSWTWHLLSSGTRGCIATRCKDGFQGIVVQEFAGTCGANPLENQDGFLNGRNHFFSFACWEILNFFRGEGRMGKNVFSPFLKSGEKVMACFLCSLLFSIYYCPRYLCVLYSMPLVKEEKVCVGLWKAVSLYIIKR